MKKTRYLLATLGLMLALGLVVVAQVPAEIGLPAAGRARLEGYVAFRYGAEGAAVVALGRARAPWRLTPEPGAAVFGESVYFPSDLGPEWRAQDGRLPYPPQEAWCVRLEASASAGLTGGLPASEIVLVALHMNLYNGDWMVHVWPTPPALDASAGAASQASARAALSAVDCDLDQGPAAQDALLP
jgi:hypothetical protein